MMQPLSRGLAGNTLRHLEQLIGGLSAGVILIDIAGTIIWANGAALAMHGVADPAELGATADDYAQRFALRFRNGHRLASREYPLMRALAGRASPTWWWRCRPPAPTSPAGRTTSATS